jgi:hypothetical protein
VVLAGRMAEAVHFAMALHGPLPLATAPAGFAEA